MKKEDTELTKREVTVLRSCLMDACGFPFHKYEHEVKENYEQFSLLFDKLYEIGILDSSEIDLAILALKQEYLHGDQYCMLAVHDDVMLEEVKALLDKLNRYIEKGGGR